MVKITKITGRGISIRGNDIDTDRIIPARYLKVISFAGIGKFAFQDLRFDDAGNKKDHPFNDQRFAGAQILFVNDNFGCGSSREHAPQALKDFGITAIVGESFAEIFAGNCTSIGIPTITLPLEAIHEIQENIETHPDTAISLDIESAQVSLGSKDYAGTMKSTFQSALITGMWDTTGALLSNKSGIEKTIHRLPYMQYSGNHPNA